MPSRTSHPPPGEPKTLFEARELIKRLRAAMPGTSGELSAAPHQPPIPAGTKPVPAPSTAPRPVPDPSRPGSPGTNLAMMPPRMLSDFLALKTDKELKVLLAVETGRSRKTQDPALIQKLYKELKKR